MQTTASSCMPAAAQHVHAEAIHIYRTRSLGLFILWKFTVSLLARSVTDL